MKKRDPRQDPNPEKTVKTAPASKKPLRGLEILEEAGYRLVKAWLTPAQEDRN